MTTEQLITVFYPDSKKIREWTEEDLIQWREFRATCPAHNDPHRSLSILAKTRKGDDQVIGIRYVCQAGCSPESIIKMAGMIEAPEKPEEPEEPKKPEALPAVAGTAEVIQATGQNVEQLMAAARGLAEMLQATNARMAAMEESLREMRATIRTLEKVTPGQAAEINKKIRERAGEICREYRLGQEGDTLGWVVPGENGEPVDVEYGQLPFRPDPEKLKAMAAEIRKDVREMTGVKTAREIARCDYQAVTEFVATWEDYDRIQQIRKKGAKG